MAPRTSHRTPAALTAIVIAWVVASVGLARDAGAVPSFARRYHVPCATCHTTITRRSEFGEVFRQNGYQWPEAEVAEVAPAADAQAPAGSAGIEMRGSSLLDGLLPDSLPLAVALTSSASYTFAGAGAPSAITLGGPTPTLLFGGGLGPHVTVFGTWTGQGTPGELAVVLRHLGGSPALNLRVGRFEQTTTVFKNNEALLGRYQLGASSLTGFAVSVGRAGVELSGALAARTFYAVGAVQDGGAGSKPDAYYHLSQKVGGIDLRGRQPDVDLEHPCPLDDVSLTVSHWGLRGTVWDAALGDTARIWRFGLDAKLRFRELEVWSGVMLGADRNLVAARREPSVTWFGEASYGVTGWLRPVYLVQLQDSSTFERVHLQHDVGALLMVLENVRVRGAYTFRRDAATANSLDLQLLVAF